MGCVKSTPIFAYTKTSSSALFRPYIDITLPQLSTSDILIYQKYGCTARFVSDLIWNTEDSLSPDTAQIILYEQECKKVDI